MSDTREGTPTAKALDALKQARDELRMRLKLASMDARDAYHAELEPKFQELAKRLEPAGEAAYDFVDVSTDVLYAHVRDGFRELLDRLDERRKEREEE